MKNCYYTYSKTIYLMIAILIISISGCIPMRDVKASPDLSDNQKKLKQSLEKGYNAFFQEDFEKASTIFKSLRNSRDETISKNARFAYLCTQLILTDTHAATKSAVGQLEQLSKSDTMNLDGENLKVLNTLLKRRLSTLDEKDEPEPTLDERCAYQYLESIQIKNEKIEQLNKKIKTFKKEVFTLKNKIKSIEEIDQKIQEKKSPLQN